MSTNLEIEFKTLLSMGEYERLLTRFSHVKPVRQVNHYFDTPALTLRGKKLALRVRVFSDWAEMCIKIPQAIGNIEHNIALTVDEATQILESDRLDASFADISEVSDVIEAAGVKLATVHELGNLTTVRYEYQMPIGKAALDSNSYLGVSDYEFELEVEDQAQGQKDFDDFLAANDIEFRYARSKVVRFLDTLRHRK